MLSATARDYVDIYPRLLSDGSELSSGKMTARSMEEEEGVQTQFRGDCQRHRMVWAGPGCDRGGRRAAAPRGMFEEARASELADRTGQGWRREASWLTCGHLAIDQSHRTLGRADDRGPARESLVCWWPGCLSRRTCANEQA